MQRTHRRIAVAGLAAILSILSLTACVSASDAKKGSPSTTATYVSDASKLKIAYFSAGTSNDYLLAGIAGVKETAAKNDISVDVFDAQFDPQTQVDQVETAITSHKYNAFVAEVTDGNLLCDALTTKAQAAGILVAAINSPLCGRQSKSGDELREPGTVTFVGGQAVSVFEKWVDLVKSDYPKGAKIALVLGPELNANTVNTLKAVKSGFGSTYDIVATQTTDYTTTQGFAATQTIIQAHPDVDVIMSGASSTSEGIIQATAGSKIAVYDVGGSKWAISQLKSGALKNTLALLPYSEGAEGVQAIIDRVNGKKVPAFIDLSKSKLLPGTPFLTVDNADKFTPQD